MVVSSSSVQNQVSAFDLDFRALPFTSDSLSLIKSSSWPVYHGNGENSFTTNNISIVNANSASPPLPPVPVSLRVNYPAGTYQAPSVSSASIGGAQFYLIPFGYPGESSVTEVLLQYRVYFPLDFPWTLGGKLPGVFGGSLDSGSLACSGGRQSDGFNCFSVRLMWRANANGEAYLYVSDKNSHLCQYPNVCDDEYGLSLGRGMFKFTAGTWNAIGIYVRLNTPGKRNGIVQIFKNGELVINSTNILFQDADGSSNASLPPTTLMFSTFFGGSTVAWAAPYDTYTQFGNISAAFGNAPYLPVPSRGTKLRPKRPSLMMFALGLITLHSLLNVF
ncbi:hypothetical protein BJ742DRAFT_753808 [Cladochytrium replicatum]|nr:hypothetical protein BJ742DRAFT_753808 [Cladochytrium replicatum]